MFCRFCSFPSHNLLNILHKTHTIPTHTHSAFPQNKFINQHNTAPQGLSDCWRLWISIINTDCEAKL